MNWQDLIAASRLLIQDPDCSESAVRRAVSTAYYAVFHALAESNADALTRTAQVPVLDENVVPVLPRHPAPRDQQSVQANHDRGGPNRSCRFHGSVHQAPDSPRTS